MVTCQAAPPPFPTGSPHPWSTCKKITQRAAHTTTTVTREPQTGFPLISPRHDPHPPTKGRVLKPTRSMTSSCPWSPLMGSGGSMAPGEMVGQVQRPTIPPAPNIPLQPEALTWALFISPNSLWPSSPFRSVLHSPKPLSSPTELEAPSLYPLTSCSPPAPPALIGQENPINPAAPHCPPAPYFTPRGAQ